jgi:hypothetical protein
MYDLKLVRRIVEGNKSLALQPQMDGLVSVR